MNTVLSVLLDAGATDTRPRRHYPSPHFEPTGSSYTSHQAATDGLGADGLGACKTVAVLDGVSLAGAGAIPYDVGKSLIFSFILSQDLETTQMKKTVLIVVLSVLLILVGCMMTPTPREILDDPEPMLDHTFGTDGMVIFNHPDGVNGLDYASGLVIDDSGNILVCITTDTAAGTEMGVLRYADAGVPDGQFFSAGAGGTDAFGAEIAIDSQGRIIVFGFATNVNSDWVLWRLNADLTLDTTFKSGGFAVYTDIAGGAGPDAAYSMAVLDDGSIVMAGYAGGVGDQDVAVAKVDSNGNLVSGFGTGGVWTYDDIGGGPGNDRLSSLAVDGDKIYIAGHAFRPGGTRTMYVARLNSNGSLDTTFDDDGIKIIENVFGTPDVYDFLNGITIDPHGRILLSGNNDRSDGNYRIFVARLEADGCYDLRFHIDGVTTIDHDIPGEDRANQTVVDSQGRIILTGFMAGANDPGNLNLFLARILDDGSLDPSFGNGGYHTAEFSDTRELTPDLRDDRASGIAIDANGMIVIAGYVTKETTNRDVAIWRYR